MMTLGLHMGYTAGRGEGVSQGLQCGDDPGVRRIGYPGTGWGGGVGVPTGIISDLGNMGIIVKYDGE